MQPRAIRVWSEFAADRLGSGGFLSLFRSGSTFFCTIIFSFRNCSTLAEDISKRLIVTQIKQKKKQEKKNGKYAENFWTD